MGIFSFLERKIKLADLEKELSLVTTNAAGQIYFKELALQIAKSYIANTISKCEFKVFHNGEEVHDQLYYMLNVSPNPNQNSSQFLNALIMKYYSSSEGALVYPDEDKNRLYVADSFSVDEKPLSENVFSNISIENATLSRKLKASKVFHFRMDDVRIRTLIDGAFTEYNKVLGSAIEAFLRRNGKKYKLALEQYRTGDPAFVQVYEQFLKKQLEAFITNANAVYPEFKGQKLEEFSNTTQSGTGNASDVIDIRKEMFETVAQAFKIPLAMMYGNITSINDMINMYLTFAIDPLADMIGEEITRKMYTFNQWKRGCYVKVDTSCISHVDILDVADKISQAVGSGVVCLDDLRERIGKPPLDNELGKMHFVTRNYATPEEVLAKKKPESKPAPEKAVKIDDDPAEKGGEMIDE